MSVTNLTEREFPIHTAETAPDGSKAPMEWYAEQFGIVPNLAGILAESPALLNAYWETQKNLLAQAALTAQEINIVQTSVAHANACQYCVAGHTAFGKMEAFGNTDEQLNAVRADKTFEDPKMEALREFTLLVLRNQGRMATSQLQSFIDAGFSRQAALDVVACVAAKVMSNYANQIALTPVDEAFAPLAVDLPYHEDRTVHASTATAA